MRIGLQAGGRSGQELRRVTVEFRLWMIKKLDKEARGLGVPRQTIFKVWMGERLDRRDE